MTGPTVHGAGTERPHAAGPVRNRRVRRGRRGAGGRERDASGRRNRRRVSAVAPGRARGRDPKLRDAETRS